MTNFPFHANVVDVVAQGHEIALKGVKTGVDAATDAVAAFPVTAAEDIVESTASFVDAGFALAEDVMGRNRDFMGKLFAALAPLYKGEAEVVESPVKAAA